MFSRLFGSKKKEESTEEGSVAVSDWSFVGTDIHSHFIPGIDDGAQTVEESIAMITALQALGYTSIVTTPHINYDHYPNTSDRILTGLASLHEVLKEQGITIPVKAAAEYFIDDYFMQILDREPLLTITQNQVLVEFSFAFQPVQLFEILFKMQTLGYKPIIAHPERYLFFIDKQEMYEELKNRGCLLQLNILALAGYYGGEIKNTAEKLIEKGLYDYCGTDMHNMRHADVLQKFTKSKHFAKLAQYPFQNSKIVML